MQSVFVDVNNDGIKEFNLRGHGYKTLKIEDSVLESNLTPVVLEADDSTSSLVLKAIESDGTDVVKDAHKYFICKEFGLTNLVSKEKNVSNVDVIFLEKGYMLVHVTNGLVCVNATNKSGESTPLAVFCGDNFSSAIDMNEIKWTDANNLLSYITGMEKDYYSRFPYEFQHSLILGGSTGTFSFYFKEIFAKVRDLSLGWVATARQEALAKEQSKTLNNFMNSVGTDTDEYDEDSDYDEFEDEDDDDDDLVGEL
jgi:hypothetical protein